MSVYIQMDRGESRADIELAACRHPALPVHGKLARVPVGPGSRVMARGAVSTFPV